MIQICVLEWWNEFKEEFSGQKLRVRTNETTNKSILQGMTRMKTKESKEK